MNVLMLVPIVVVILCWLLSLRRTPFAVEWLAVSVGLAGLGVLMVGLAEAVHHTTLGLIAATVASCVLPAFTTWWVESCALDTPGTSPRDIAKWRKDRKPALPAPTWVVVTQAYHQIYDHDTETFDHNTVRVGIRAGEKTRWLGDADPLEDMNAFMDLRAQAEQAAETLNALKIGT